MRLIALLLALCPISVFAGEVHRLWSLVDQAERHPAPRPVQAALSRSERAALDNCAGEQGYSNAQLAGYFSALEVKLEPGTRKTYAVFPSLPCSEFFGAHAVRFWIVALDEQGNVSVLLSAQQDSFEVLEAKSAGIRDLKLRYNNESVLMRFNGANYEPAKQ
jgi:hypothetical protein